MAKAAEEFLRDHAEDELNGAPREWLELVASESRKMTSTPTGCVWRVEESDEWELFSYMVSEFGGTRETPFTPPLTPPVPLSPPPRSILSARAAS